MEQILIGNAIYLSNFMGTPEELISIPQTGRVRIEVNPENNDVINCLNSDGFFPRDLTLEAEINLSEIDSKFERMCRYRVEREDYSSEILSIAKDIFTYDKRFDLEKVHNQITSEQQIEAYLELGRKRGAEWLLCKYKDKLGGFIELLKYDNHKHFIYLGGVLPQFQRFGMALSLYYNACRYCYSLGDKSLVGRISATNMAVMNLYSKLGATFSKPLVILVREV